MYTNNMDQLLQFVYFMLIGMLLSTIFDIFRILRKSFQTSDFITNIEDSIFGFLAGIILLASIFWINNGQLRFYILIGIAFGIFIYLAFISKYFIKLNIFMIETLKKIFKFITKPIFYIIKWIKKIIFKPFSIIIINIRLFFKKIIIKIYKIVKKRKKSL